MLAVGSTMAAVIAFGGKGENEELVTVEVIGAYQEIPSQSHLDEALAVMAYTPPTPEPSPTPEPTPTNVPLPQPRVLVERPRAQPSVPGMPINGYATHYGGGPAWGDKVDYNGGTLGCGGTYRSEDPTIVAVSPERYSEWPCGTRLEVCGPVGCIIVTRQDACPGCSANVVDLSESGHQLVCGVGTCQVTIRMVP